MTETNSSNSTKGAEMLSVRALLEKKFRIPPYQRAYDWEVEHASQFATDIIELARKIGNEGKSETPSHFLGTIVCTSGQGDRLEVVDGQQRLTSIFLFLAQALRASSGRSLIEGSEPNLITQDDDHVVFKGFLYQEYDDAITAEERENIYETRAQLKMHHALDAFRKKVKDEGFDVNNGYHELHDALLDNDKLVLVTLDSDADAARLFETINNRGKSVSQLDLIKNYLIDYQKSINAESKYVQDAWRVIESHLNDKALSSEDGNTVLQAAVTAMTGSHRRKDTTNASIIRGHIVNKGDEGKFHSFLAFLKASFKSFRELRNASDPDLETGYKKQLAYLNYHPTISGVLPMIFARYFVAEGNLDGELLKLIEKVNFRLYGLPSRDRADAHNKKFAEFAQRHLAAYKNSSAVINFNRKSDQVVGKADEELKKDLEGLLAGEQKDFPETVFKSLVLADNDPSDFYNWPWLAYFLARWESAQERANGQSFTWTGLRKHSKELGLVNYSIEREHIFPNGAGKDGSDKTPVYLALYENGMIKRRLGNFTLCPKGVNIELSNNNIDEKIKIINESEVTLTQGVRGIKSIFEVASEAAGDIFGKSDEKFEDMSEKRNVVQALCFIDLRERELANFAIKTWKLDGEDIPSKGKFEIRSMPAEHQWRLTRKELGDGARTYEYAGKSDLNYFEKTSGG